MNGEQSNLQTNRRKRLAAPALVPDRLPPSSVEAEIGVLGCILLDPRECMSATVSGLKPGAEAFYDLRHQVIFQALLDMDARQENIDVITLQQRLKDSHQLEAVGGIAYLMSLTNEVPSAANLPFYLKIVVDKFLLRRSIRVAGEFLANAYENDDEATMIVDAFESQVLSIRDQVVAVEATTTKELIHQSINEIERYHKLDGRCGGISTGWPDLDKVHDGLHGNELITVSARPGGGKTALMLNIAEHVAVQCDVPVVIFTKEMSELQCTLRMLCSLARVNLRSIREGFMAERDFPKLTNAASRIQRSPVIFRSAFGMSIYQIKAEARRYAQRKGARVFVIDYFQLLDASGSGRKFGTQTEELTEVSRMSKAIARENNATVLMGAQFNPKNDEIKNCSALFDDTDSEWRLIPATKTDEDDEDKSVASRVTLHIRKQRNGPCPERVELVFLKEFTRFESVSRVSAEDIPQGDTPAFL